jgi:protein-L-isoaspartate(D-aspartate) O-methyltransferase
VDEDLSQMRDALAESVRGNAGPLVVAALRAVPRHLFLPDVPAGEVYTDEAVVTKRDASGRPVSSSSQPALMASMLDQLALEPGQRVLEIGAGTGYNAALIRHIVGPSGTVVSIDIDQDIVDAARDHLAAAGYPDVIVLCRDGAEGAAEHAPFDRLIATVGLSDLSPAWLAQLSAGARMVVPVELRGPMLCVALEREDGHWASRSTQPCGFIKVRGALAGSSVDVPLTGKITLHLPEQRDIDLAAVAQALSGGAAVTVPAGMIAGRTAVMWGLQPWLSGSEPRTCTVTEDEPADVLPVPPWPHTSIRSTLGLVSGGSIALLAVPGGSELAAAGYGPDGGSLATALAGQMRAWDAAGRPGPEGLHVDVYPADADMPAPAGLVINRPSTRFAVYRA